VEKEKNKKGGNEREEPKPTPPFFQSMKNQTGHEVRLKRRSEWKKRIDGKNEERRKKMEDGKRTET
jgi:hypothetical protein